MKELIGRILAYYGRTAEVESADGAQTVRAFLQPVTENGWESLRRSVRAIGEIPRGRSVYIGPAEVLPDEGAAVRCGGKDYRVQRAERLFLADEAIYVWGLLREAGGETDAGTDRGDL